MRLSPEDFRLRQAIRELVAKNVRVDGQQKIMFLNQDLEVREVVYQGEISRGGHIEVRERLLREGEVRAILHLGLLNDGFRRAFIHVVDSKADQDLTTEEEVKRLMCLRQARGKVYWVPPGDIARDAWTSSWHPT
jgi:hypothetical protein